MKAEGAASGASRGWLWALAGFVALVFGCFVWLSLPDLRGGEAHVTVLNGGTRVVFRGKLKVCSKEFVLPRLEPGSVARLTATGLGDGDYAVQALYEGGGRLVDTVGYVTSGMLFTDTLVLGDSEVVLRSHSGGTPGFAVRDSVARLVR